ncbi:MAG: NRDE family protein [Prosthecobacter sp.]
MTWARSPGELVLCFNRDEQHSRAVSLPPRLWNEGFLAPTDVTAGGTWLAVRRDGVVLALLNHYPKDFQRRYDASSRGALVAALAGAGAKPSIELMRELGVKNTNPFRLVVLGLRQETEIFTWDGKKLTRKRHDDDAGFITSSSWNTKAVTASRQGMFRAWLRRNPTPTMAAMRAFHCLPTHPRGSAYAVCMWRPDARSVSLNTVRMTAFHAEMTQQPRDMNEPSFSIFRHETGFVLAA